MLSIALVGGGEFHLLWLAFWALLYGLPVCLGLGFVLILLRLWSDFGSAKRAIICRYMYWGMVILSGILAAVHFRM